MAAGVFGAAALAWPYFSADVPQWLPLNRLTGGAKVDNNDAPADSWLPISPQTLANTAGVSVEVYSLARAIRSEAGSASSNERVAVGWCIVNQAAAKYGGDVTRAVTAGNSGAGYFGAQNLGGRYVSTRYSPRTADLVLAEGILDGAIPDPTGGATKFFNPSLQDYLYRKGTKRYTKTSQDVLNQWAADGYQASPVDGVDPDKFLVFRYVGKGMVVS